MKSVQAVKYFILEIVIFLTFPWNGLFGEPIAEHVVVVGIDGCRPELILEAGGPMVESLWKEGAYTLKAQAVLPSVTHVNFASILSGSIPEKHGINERDWDKGGEIPKVKVTTVFEVVAKNGMKAAGFFGHEKLYPSEVDMEDVYIEHSPHNAIRAAEMAADFLLSEKPQYCFVYMGDLDGAGHKYGWLSEEQYAAMENIDKALGIIVSALQDGGMWGKTVLMITADHGGHGKSHGEGTEEDVTIPFICLGPKVKKNYEIRSEIHNYDSAAIALYVLGIPIPKFLDGKPPLEIFESSSKKPLAKQAVPKIK